MSKKKLDCAWLSDPEQLKIKTRVFDNSPAGFRALLQWAGDNSQSAVAELHLTLEATGVYPGLYAV